MSARPVRRTVAIEHFAITQLALIITYVSRDSKEMECHVRTSTSVVPTFIVVALMHTEATPLARTIAFVFQDSEEVDDHALTLMSVTQICTIAVITSCALIL